ncbi:hypothetical protein DSL72_000940 [Monilinia vaccinii-corymbosi]|uniref:Uncharacterized protein n=1 Tax=Monilinia vaccinii-corymbosi TaxID=61207 RepID=A0A8A3P0F0_9HELO|nr:hypothetical protein DSL72_000940 [Monilinia vaccinii-corymbosi]
MEKQSCQDYEHDSDARLFAELKILSAMEQEYARPNPDSTKRVLTSTKPQELQNPDESEVSALLNHSSKEDGAPHSEENHAYCKTLHLRSEPSMASKQSVQQCAPSHDLRFSEPNETLSRDAIMGKYSAIPALSNMDGNFESSHSHAQHISSVFEIPMLYDQWQRISQARSRISGLRETLRIMRLRLRRLRDHKSLVDDA